ncbi:MAG: hypothetical protein GKR90_08640 [Pseudomonadales bacterium]|nr:hypothetical protein [Pseudomonadales bacterium]
MRKLTRICSYLGLVLLASGGNAVEDGGGANLIYDMDQPISLTGTVTGYKAKDPHSELYVEVKQEGHIKQWTILGGAAGGIARAGLTNAYLTSKPTVTVTVFQSRDGACRPRCVGLGRDFKFDRE